VMKPYAAQLFEPTDTVQLAEKLAWYLNRPAEREAAHEAQRSYVQHFDIGVVGTRLLTVYAHALQSRREL
jgi:glycosyltransferase involved in cell wall biosynthesis